MNLYDPGPGSLQDVGGWGVKMEVLRLLVALASGFRRLLQPHLAGVLEAAWALFVACLPVYQQMVVIGCEDLEQDVRFPASQSPNRALPVACLSMRQGLLTCAWTLKRMRCPAALAKDAGGRCLCLQVRQHMVVEGGAGLGKGVRPAAACVHKDRRMDAFVLH